MKIGKIIACGFAELSRDVTGKEKLFSNYSLSSFLIRFMLEVERIYLGRKSFEVSKLNFW